jgi:hypothetical protein
VLFCNEPFVGCHSKDRQFFYLSKTGMAVLASVVMDFKGWRFPA